MAHPDTAALDAVSPSKGKKQQQQQSLSPASPSWSGASPQQQASPRGSVTRNTPLSTSTTVAATATTDATTRPPTLKDLTRVTILDDAAASIRSSLSDLQDWALSGRVISSPRKSGAGWNQHQNGNNNSQPYNDPTFEPLATGSSYRDNHAVSGEREHSKGAGKEATTTATPLVCVASNWLNAFTVCSSLSPPFTTTTMDRNTSSKSSSYRNNHHHHTGCGGDAGGDASHDPEIISLMDSKEYDEMQVKRLTSWATIGTCGTIGTNYSDALSAGTMDAAASTTDIVLDDDGVPIDRKILEMTITTRERRMTRRRKRLVKFDYPPISKLKECPRLDPQVLPDLFFTEEELDMYEEDRISTYNADDIEIVANSSSLSEEDDEMARNDGGHPSSSHHDRRRQSSSSPLDPREVLQRRAAAYDRDAPPSSSDPPSSGGAHPSHTNSSPSTISASPNGGSNNNNFGNYVSTPRLWGATTATTSSSKAATFSKAHYGEEASSSIFPRPSFVSTSGPLPQKDLYAFQESFGILWVMP